MINLWFLALLVCEFVFLGYEVFDRRMLFHDTLHVMANQYYMLNGLVEYGQIPLWTPYINHGDVMMWWNVLQGSSGFVMKSAALFPWLLKYIPFPAFFFAAILGDVCRTVMVLDLRR